MITVAWEERAHKVAAVLRPWVYQFVGRALPGIRLEDVTVEYVQSLAVDWSQTVRTQPKIVVKAPCGQSIIELSYLIEDGVVDMGSIPVNLNADISKSAETFKTCAGWEPEHVFARFILTVIQDDLEKVLH